MYLLDTNIRLERLLNQSKAHDVKLFLDRVDDTELALSDFSLHSICVILGRTRKLALLDQFIHDLFVRGKVALLGLTGAELLQASAAMQAHPLDFDDAYQYALAKRNQLAFVSFDTDFHRTDLVRLTPAQILATPAAAPPAPSS